MHRLAEDEFRRSRIDAEDPAAQREAIVDTLRVLDLRSAAGRAKGNFIGLGRGRRGR